MTKFEDHCFDDTWKAAMESMLSQNAIVLMDLRGFGPANQGCLYELGVLRDRIAMGAVAFLIDSTTELDFLKTTLEKLWSNMGSYSPNVSDAKSRSQDDRRITVFNMSDSERSSARALVALLTEACVAGESYNQSRGQSLLKALIDDLHLLAADAPVQAKAVGGGRAPGEKVLEAGYSCDPDFDTPSHLVSWGLITEAQHVALLDVHEAAQQVRHSVSELTLAAMSEDPAWQKLRVAARRRLQALGTPPRAPKPRDG